MIQIIQIIRQWRTRLGREKKITQISFGILVMLFSCQMLMAAQGKIVIAVQPTATADELSSQAQELEAYLKNVLGQEVQVLFPASYAGVIEALRFGHAQAAFMGAWPALLATQNAGAKVALAEIREVIIDANKTEAPHYYSYWVVKKESPYQTLEELRGKKAAFPNQLSTSGYVAPLSTLVRKKLVLKTETTPADPKKYFSSVNFAGGYAQAWESLKNSQSDVSVIAGDVNEKLCREVLDATRVIETQGPIPSHAVVLSKDLAEPLRSKLISAFKGLGDESYRPLMRKFVSGIFVRFDDADEKHLEPLGAMLKDTGLEFQEKK